MFGQHLEISPSILYFGTPVVIISSLNPEGTTNLAPLSSAWALGYTVVLGLGNDGQTVRNLRHHGTCVLNFPPATLWQQVETLGRTTGNANVPQDRQARGIRFDAEKYAAADLAPVASLRVQPTGILECPIRMECAVRSIQPLHEEEDASVVQVRVLRVTAEESLVVAGRHIHPERWNPLIYNFRHYFGLGDQLGAAGHSETRMSAIQAR